MEDATSDDLDRVATSQNETGAATPIVQPTNNLSTHSSSTTTTSTTTIFQNPFVTQQNATYPSFSQTAGTGTRTLGGMGFAFSQPFSSEHYGRFPTEVDDRHVTTRRRAHTTNEGREHQVDLLRKRNTIIARRIKQQVSILDGLQMGIDRGTIKAEVARLDNAIQELDEVTSRIIDIIGDANEGNLLRQTMEEFEALAVRAKQGAYALISRSNSGSSCSSSSSRRNVRHWLTQSLPSDVQVVQGDGNLNYPEMLHITDNLRCKLTQRLATIEELLCKGDAKLLTEELERLELMH